MKIFKIQDNDGNISYKIETNGNPIFLDSKDAAIELAEAESLYLSCLDDGKDKLAEEWATDTNDILASHQIYVNIDNYIELEEIPQRF